MISTLINAERYLLTWGATMSVQLPPENFPDEIRAIMARLNTDRERLEWAVDFAQEDIKGLTRGRLADLMLEWLVFGLLGGARHQVTIGDVTLYEVTKAQLLHAQKAFARILEDLLQRGESGIGRFSVYLIVGVDQGNPYHFAEVSGAGANRDDEEHDLEALARFSLGLLLVGQSHLVKSCPAPALRSRKGELCGRWFVGRPNQTYCTSICQNRATTRTSRQKSDKKKGK